MKSFKAFRLDRENHILWRNEDRVPMAPKEFDILAYLVEHAGRVVTQDQILDALWSETYVNPEVLRKYILEIRKTLGDRPENPAEGGASRNNQLLYVGSCIFFRRSA